MIRTTRVARTSKNPLVTNGQAPSDGTSSCALPEAAPTSKIGQVVNMLKRPGGAALAELANHTGWLPHTTRAALTGLRKKGHVIVKESREGVTFYSIGKAGS